MDAYLKSILNAFNDLLFVFTGDGIIEDYIATDHEDELIRPKETFLGKHHRQVLPPHISKKIERAFNKLDQGKKQVTFDYDIKLRGETRWYNAALSKINHKDEVKYLGAVRNITDRKNQELLLQGILNTSPAGIMVLKNLRDTKDTLIDFEIVQVNKSAEVLTSASEEELVGQKVTSVVAESAKEKIFNRFKSVVETANPIEFQYQHINEQGEVLWFHINVIKFKEGIISTFMNITEQKKAEDKLARKNKKLTQLNRQKDKLFSVISHDLRNAVGGAKGIYAILLEDYEEFSKEDILEYLELLNKNTRETHDLLEDLLAWSKVQLGEVSRNIEKLHLTKLTDLVFDKVKPDAEDKGINLHNRIPDTIYLHADASMVKTILRNLVDNGIKFSHPGGKVIVNAEITGDTVTISVTDEGVGIKKEAQEKVLNKEHSFKTFGTKGEKGSGFGLDLCIDFVEMHGGTLELESEPDKGSTFTFTLPVGNT